MSREHDADAEPSSSPQKGPLFHIGYPTTPRWLTSLLMGRNSKATLCMAPEADVVSRLVLPGPLVYTPRPVRAWFDQQRKRCEATGKIPVLSSSLLGGRIGLEGYDTQIIARRLNALASDATILIVIREQRRMILALEQAGLLPNSSTDGLPAFHPHFLEYHRLIKVYRDLFTPKQVLVCTCEELELAPLATTNRILQAVGAGALEALPSDLETTRPEPSPAGVAGDRSAPLAPPRASSPWSQVVAWAKRQGLLAVTRRNAGRTPLLMDFDYRASNGQTEELTGLDLQSLGYPCEATRPNLLRKTVALPTSGPAHREFVRFREARTQPEQAFDRAHSQFGEHLTDQDGSVKRRIQRHLKRGIPGSFVRFGDGEGMVLALASAEYPALAQHAARFYSLRQFGAEEVVLQNSALLIDAFRRVLANADAVGIMPLYHLRLLINQPPERAGVAPFCIVSLYDYLARHGEQLGLRDRATCSANFHLELLPELADLIAGRDIGLISCHEMLASALTHKLRAKSVRFHPVPKQALIVPGDFTPNGHLPARYAELVEELQCIPPGMLYLIGAGLPGKIYCDVVRASGGIGLDMGSCLDILAGVPSRFHHRRNEYRAMRIT